jgi:hypothetical protein
VLGLGRAAASDRRDGMVVHLSDSPRYSSVKIDVARPGDRNRPSSMRACCHLRGAGTIASSPDLDQLIGREVGRDRDLFPRIEVAAEDIELLARQSDRFLTEEQVERRSR